MRIAVFATVMLLALSACGVDFSGEYGEMNEGKWETAMTFKDGNVEMDFGMMNMVGTYELKDDKVYVTMNGATMAWPIDREGCIESGVMAGRVCKKP